MAFQSCRAPSQARRHSRSFSHPLDTALGHGKKANASSRDEPNVFAKDVQDRSTPFSMPGSRVYESSNVSDGRLRPGAKEMEIGHCATCGSTVKWPRNLSVFRCTVCLMVNDVRQSGAESWEQSENRTDEKLPVLSLRRTAILIDRCIRLHLQSRLIPGHDIQWKSGKTLQAQRCTHSGQKRDLQQETSKSSLSHGRSDDTMLDVDYARYDYLQDREEQPFRAEMPTLSYSLPVLRVQARPDAGALPRPLRLVQLATLPPARPLQSAGLQASQCREKATSPSIFRLLEHYIIYCFRDINCLNASFSSHKPAAPIRSVSEDTAAALPKVHYNSDMPQTVGELFEMDAKTLLLGDVAENGGLNRPQINWTELQNWYQAILDAGQDWRLRLKDYLSHASPNAILTAEDEVIIEADFTDSRKHLHRTLLKASETLLRRPGRPIQTTEDCRFLVFLAANPLLHRSESNDDESVRQEGNVGGMGEVEPPLRIASKYLNCHAGIIKRILGMLANLPQANHRSMISWWTQCPNEEFQRLVDLVGGFVTHRLMRQRRKSQGASTREVTRVLVPEFSASGLGGSAQLHAALARDAKMVNSGNPMEFVNYRDDWQIKVAAKVMSLLVLANRSNYSRPQRHIHSNLSRAQRASSAHRSALDATRSNSTPASKGRSRYSDLIGHDCGQLLPTNAFYNTVLDYCDLIADFEAWENQKQVFSFCQYPMFLSLWAKIRILEYDARRQMEIKARQAFFSSIMTRQAESQFLVLKVRRECLVEDSLRGVSEVVGASQEDIKKGLRIAFAGEDGVDAGGLRKEWFLLLVREVFDPVHGLFVYDDDSRYCYFNPYTFETSDQFFLVGVVLGLAIYNSTILDVALPPFLYRKLLASGSCPNGFVTSAARPALEYTLADLGEFRPTLASGLQQLLEYDGDVEETFCHDFVVESERYGQSVQVPLCPNGEQKALTNSNRAEFVKLYVKHLLDISVSRQFEPFKRGFFSVCGSNALSLFCPEEIELLIRGSAETLDVSALRAVAIYDGWKKRTVVEDEALIEWFWELFGEADTKQQRALLCFITGSDRLPAMGATSLIIKISCLGNEAQRFPIARTCFNMIGLYQYASKEDLHTKLWRAVAESHGFGLK
ncbi:MAG: hypothetical protein LQ352_001944 [Teloschistes flavicans]|nr:MAG: hypothetical protein LQ352_001944 [Teloschistes flavicans]